MAKTSKKQKNIYQKYDRFKSYPLTEASSIVKDISSYTYFDSSIDIAIHLGVDPRKPNQMIRGVVKLPHGTGKKIRILALVTPDKENEARQAGADYVGSDEYLAKIKNGWTNVDTIITTPMMMPKIGILGKILGPKGLMPNPKSGTVTFDIKTAVQEVKSGKINFKTDRCGNVHASVGRASFISEKIMENTIALIQMIQRLKPSSSKGVYVKSISLSGTMSPRVQVDVKSVLYN